MDILQVDANAPDPDAIARAAQILREGGLVAFPTETVYGLGANALDPQAVAGIYVAKGRPSNNPLIVHIPDAATAQRYVTAWPDEAERLAARFWPGPLTLVLPKADNIADIVTGGGATIALRVPAHPVALALLRSAGLPLAAPSANRSTEISPTRAEHVVASLAGKIALVLDGGPTSGGLESTVLNLTTPYPSLLRPGLISPAEIRAVIGRLDRFEAPSVTIEGEAMLSPGLNLRHYAPRARLEVAPEGGRQRVLLLLQQGMRVGWLTLALPTALPAATPPECVYFVMPDSPKEYAALLYARLHELDAAGVQRIVVDLPPNTESWLAVHDRLRRAAAPDLD